MNRRADLVAVLTLEREIEAIAAQSLSTWLASVHDAVLPVLTAAAADVPPDPDAIMRTAPAWERQVDSWFLRRFGLVLDRLLGENRDRLGDWRTSYLSSVRVRLLSVPAAAVRRVRAAIRDTADASVRALRELAARALDYAASWRADAARIGRDEAVAVFNAARLAAAELEQRDTDTQLDKVWLCLHDDRTRTTHRHADRQRVPLAAAFTVGAAQLQYPHDPDGPPEEVCGCRCVITIINSARENPAPAQVASAADTGGTTMARSFEALLIPTGVIGRSRMSMLASTAELVDTALPLPLKWQPAAVGGHDGSVTVGVIETLTLRDGGVWGTGTMLDTPEAGEAVREIEAQVTQPSAELVVRAETMTDAAGTPITPETAEALWLDGAEIVMRWDAVEFVAASLVSVPEFRETSITLGDNAAAAPTLSLVAAAVKPDTYPAAWFDNPLLDEPTPIHMTVDGRIVGHLATWGTQHTAHRDRPVTPYRSHSGYAEFHQSHVYLEDGEILRVGRLTVGGGHGPAGRGMHAAIEHYDNVATCWAMVRAGEDEHGIWVAGVPNPHAEPKMVKQALGTPHSGHWERVAGHPELIAAHAVNTPGFPIVQRRCDRDGDLALVASFAPRQARPPIHTSILEDAARRGAAAYAEQLAAEQRAAVARRLVTVASARRRTLGQSLRTRRTARAGKES